MSEPDIEKIVDAIVEQLLPEVDALAYEFGQSCHDRMPDLNVSDDIFALTVSSFQACFLTLFSLIRSHGDPRRCEVPDRVLSYARELVGFGLTSTPLQALHRVSIERLWAFWDNRLETHIDDPARRAHALRYCMAYSFAYIERVSDAVAKAHAAEVQRWRRSPAALRVEIVRRILDGAQLDPVQVGHRLGYRLDRWHLAMLLVRGPLVPATTELAVLDDQPERPLHDAAAEVAMAVGGGPPLVLPAGPGVVWAWTAAIRRFDDGAFAGLDGTVRLAGAGVALGEPAHGTAGFQQSHRQALHALRFLDERRRHARYREVVAVSLLAADSARAREFVHSELGRLAGSDEPMARLRQTLEAYLAEGGRWRAAATRLELHENTVLGRIRRIETILGRSCTARRFELEAALRLHRELTRPPERPAVDSPHPWPGELLSDNGDKRPARF